MVKIEVEVIERSDEQCTVNVKSPRSLKTATTIEKQVANAVKNTIDKSIEALSKGI